MRFIFIFSIVLFLFTGRYNYLKANELELAFKKDTVFKGISTIKIKGYYTKILINRSDDKNIRMHAVLKADSPEGYVVETCHEDNVLEISVNTPGEVWSSHSGKLIFYVPDSIDLDIETTSGYCTINEVNCGLINVTTKSGKIKIIKSSAEFNVISSSGEIYLDELKGNLTVSSKFADISAYRIRGDVTANTSSGTVLLNNVTGKVKTETTIGKQDMDNIRGEIFAKSMSGSINISMAVGKIRILGYSGDVELYQVTGILDVSTTRGNQTGIKVKLTGDSRFASTVGKVRIKLDMPKDSITYQLKSEKAFVFALGKSKKKKLIVGNGNILVQGNSTTGSQLFY